MYRIELKPRAQKFIAAQSKKTQKQLIQRIESLAADPHPRGSKLLHAKERLYRIRSGSYRIIYQVQHDKLVVVVATVGHRRNVYNHL
ncbi:MAG TPA: type II toxin-antitoxin system RelE/ParE family toxin [Sedimentisphaerales bacterium]|nr:type II toxin-antitoxin system RelE/ParE family toxin [Sedimentisphaerales bacterium]